MSWNNDTNRIVIHTADYLGFTGQGTAGGRQRFIRDIASVIRDGWCKDLLIIQKAHENFEKRCSAGFQVVGIKSDVNAKGDPYFAYKVRRRLQVGDRLLYASGEDAWPFFVHGAKAVQHGIWWDGPQSSFTRMAQAHRALSCMKAISSMLCVDTNFINWLRSHGKLGLALANKCVYVPNYADLKSLATSPEVKTGPLRLLCARRYEEKRGIDLFIQSLEILNKKGVAFTAHISAPGGYEQVTARLAQCGLSRLVTVSEDSMDSVLDRYKFADVAVVPTIWSEGTSLACVEAICAGLPVVATPVGGLGNLIIPGFNGILTNPTPTSIAAAIEELTDTKKLMIMRTNCLSMRESLSKEAWEKRLIEWLKA